MAMERGIASIGLPPAMAPAFSQKWSCKALVRRTGVRLKAKKKSDGFWEPKEIILDKEDIAKLEFSRMVGESREKSIAKIVAKKLNPSATNLEIEKMIKRRGVKAFMDMVSDAWQQQMEQAKPNVGEFRKAAKLETTNKRSDPIPLAPKPDAPQAAGTEFSLHKADTEWSQKADLSRDNFKRLLDRKALLDKDAAVPLVSKPSTPERPKDAGIFSEALTPSDLSQGKLWNFIEKRPQPRKPRAPKSVPTKSTPELQARPSRGKQDLVEKPIKKQLSVPSLNSKPQLRLSKGENRVEVREQAFEHQEVEDSEIGSFEEVKNETRPLPILNKPTERDAIEGIVDDFVKPLQASTEPAGLLEKPVVLDNNNRDATAALDDTESSDEQTADLEEVSSAKVNREASLPALNKPKLFARRESVNGPEIPTLNKLGASQEKERKNVSSEQPFNNSYQAVGNSENIRKGNPEYFHGRASQEEIDKSWALAEIALRIKEIQEVLFVGNNVGGMIARFGTVNGFLPGKELSETRGLKTFRSWARDKGHRINHSSIWDSSESSDATFATSEVADHGVSSEAEREELVMHPECESLLHKNYSQERAAVLSSFVGQKAKVVVIYVDRERKKLVFSERKAVDEDLEAAQRRKKLMAKLRVGDTVTVNVKNISLFGIFVEVLPEGVTALINFGELSWTPVSDPSAIFQTGQEVRAKVVQLDHNRERIYLSLKRMSPDPLLESLENLLDRNGESTTISAQNTEGALNSPELDALLQRLEVRQDVEAVSKGRYLHGIAIVPSFQVYLASSDVSGGHKLLARFGNVVQEIIVQTPVDRETMKSIILEATGKASQQ